VSERKEAIQKNMQFILSLFNGQEFVFPGAIMTWKSKGQTHPKNDEEPVQYFLEAGFKDCKIKGYPFFDKDYVDKVSPSFLFIEMDFMQYMQIPKKETGLFVKANPKLNRERNPQHPYCALDCQ
jgi:hypothetical protein